MLPEKSSSAEQPTHPALRLIAARPDIFSRQGHIVATYRRKKSATSGAVKLYGPYYHLNYREDGRQCAVYLGAASPVVEAVRAALAKIQQPFAQNRLFQSITREANEAIRMQKRRINAMLRPYGLHLKGMELRGWRTSTIRAFMPRLPRVPRGFRNLSACPVKKGPVERPIARLHRYLDARDQLRMNT
jgi:hypothetical protein